MNHIIRELKRLFAGEKLEPEQLRGLIRAGYVYRVLKSFARTARATMSPITAP
jgi:hypothetical protein